LSDLAFSWNWVARLQHLDLLGDPADVRLTRAVHDEIGDKQDEVAARIAEPAADAFPCEQAAERSRSAR
jgi:hypothetical protein